MKIDQPNQNTALTYAGSGRAEKSDAHGETVGSQHGATDRVNLSGFPAAAAVSQPSDPARVQRVNELKLLIDTGTYSVSSISVAEKMIGKMLGDVTFAPAAVSA